MANFKVTVSILRVKVESLRELNTQFKAQTSEMETIEARLNGMWEGQARESFHAAFARDKVQMDNFYNAVEVFAQRLEAIAERYAQAEARSVQIATERTY